MSDSKKDKSVTSDEQTYDFGGIKEFSLQEIEAEVLSDSLYLDVFAGSDIRYKSNIEPVNDALQKINQLSAITYNYETDKFPDQNFPKSRQVGFSAQELEKVLPEVVKTNSEGLRSVNYANIAPLLSEGIKALSSIVNQQNDQIIELKGRISQLENDKK